MSLLLLQPVIIGMGFSKKTPALILKKSLDDLLKKNHYTLQNLLIPEFKQQDDNVILFQKLINIPIRYIPYAILESLQPKCQSSSSIVAKHTGLVTIAEACVIAMINKNDRLLIPKMIYNNITFSIAIKGDPS